MRTTYVPGKWLAICDVCGMRFHSDALRKDWRNLMVCAKDYETRHPQDFLRVPKDDPSIPWARPEGEDVFVPVTYICTPEGSTAIVGQAVVGCSVVGSPQGQWGIQRSAIVGIAITGQAVVGHT